MSFKTVVGAALMALAIWTTPAAAQPSTFVFTAIPDEDETKLVARFNAFAKYLEGALAVPVRYLPVKSYPAAVTAFTNGQVQLGWFGGLSGVQARGAVPGSRAIAQGAEDVAFKSFFIANAATGLDRQSELTPAIRGKTFTFGARTSTSGRLFPEHFLRRELDQAPEEIFSRVGFSGDHSRTIQLVQSGAFELGVVNHLVWASETKAGKVDPNAVRVIWETPTFPDYNWSLRGDVEATFGAGFGDRVAAAIVDLRDETLLGYFDRSAFIPARNEDYRAIEEVGKAVGLLN